MVLFHLKHAYTLETVKNLLIYWFARLTDQLEHHNRVILVKIIRFVPYATFWKTPLASSQSGIVITYLVQLRFVYYHSSGDATVYANLELSTNAKFVAYGTMVKILETLKSSYVKACYLTQKLEPAIGRMYFLQCFGNNFFSFKIWLAEDMKVLPKHSGKYNLSTAGSSFCIK